MPSSKKREIHPVLSSPKKNTTFQRTPNHLDLAVFHALGVVDFYPSKMDGVFNSPVLQQKKSRENSRNTWISSNFFCVCVCVECFCSHFSKCKMNHHISFIDSFILLLHPTTNQPPQLVSQTIPSWGHTTKKLQSRIVPKVHHDGNSVICLALPTRHPNLNKMIPHFVPIGWQTTTKK